MSRKAWQSVAFHTAAWLVLLAGLHVLIAAEHSEPQSWRWLTIATFPVFAGGVIYSDIWEWRTAHPKEAERLGWVTALALVVAVLI